MLLWEFILQSDRKADLTKKGAALEWLSSTRLIQTSEGKGLGWGDEASRRFARIVKALRSVAKRVNGYSRARQPEVDEWEADHFFRLYVENRLRFRVRRKSSNVNEPLNRKNIDRFAIEPYLPDDVAAEIDSLPVTLNERNAIKEVELIAASAFASLQMEQVAPASSRPVCSQCGVSLPARTEHGRKTRASICRPCVKRRSFDNLHDEAKREHWRRAKARQRRNKKAKSSNIQEEE